MKSIEMNSGGPVMPRSKSRATVRSAVSRGSSRCPIPGGSTTPRVSRSYRSAAVRSPRFALAACCSGVSTCSNTKTTPSATSGVVSECWSCTAPTRLPTAMASAAGNTARNKMTVHQTVASVRSARGSSRKNNHSCRLRSRPRFSLLRCNRGSVLNRPHGVLYEILGRSRRVR